MTIKITAQTYHLRYLTAEDRLLLAVDLTPEQELGLPITRRLTRNLLAALAKYVTERGGASLVENPQLRDTVLDFEHSQSVANARADGTMRESPPPKPAAQPARLVHEVKIVPKTDGGILLIFNNHEHLVTIDVARERIHMVIETFLQMADRAGWEFPPIASWLGKTSATDVTATRTVN